MLGSGTVGPKFPLEFSSKTRNGPTGDAVCAVVDTDGTDGGPVVTIAVGIEPTSVMMPSLFVVIARGRQQDAVDEHGRIARPPWHQASTSRTRQRVLVATRFDDRDPCAVYDSTLIPDRVSGPDLAVRVQDFLVRVLVVHAEDAGDSLVGLPSAPVNGKKCSPSQSAPNVPASRVQILASPTNGARPADGSPQPFEHLN